MAPPHHRRYGLYYQQPQTIVIQQPQPQGLVLDAGTVVVGALVLAFFVLVMSPKGRKR